ncbi:MAG TPA: cupin domain-containing protein [Anaerolineales bacterium]|nr:cupin domain-containing protein [Anaerolineales bacterium]
MPNFHHRKLPDGNTSTFLSGHSPHNEIGFRSTQLQIRYNNTETGWRDSIPHMHRDSDECFIVLQGSLVIDIEGERFTVGPREFVCFPRGVYHAVVEAHPPIESLMIRAPSVDDKVYWPTTGTPSA